MYEPLIDDISKYIFESTIILKLLVIIPQTKYNIIIKAGNIKEHNKHFK